MFNPTTNVYPDLHEDFKNPIVLRFEDAPTPTTAEKIKSKLADVRSKLCRVEDKWGRSGNGDGMQVLDRDNKPVLIDGELKNFLGGNKPHLLYLWKLLDETNFLEDTLAIIPKEFSASGENVVTTSQAAPRNNQLQTQIAASFAQLASASVAIAEERKVAQQQEAVKYYLELHRQYCSESDGPHKEVLKTIVEQAKKALEKYN
jgi:hypothetical protein